MPLKIRKITLAVLVLTSLISGMSAVSCKDDCAAPSKTSTSLELQLGLRRQQLGTPTPERLAQMQEMGMRTENIGFQRIYIYLNQPLTEAQVAEVRASGITMYPDSWIPPAGSHTTGFMLAEMPVNRLDALIGRDYIIRLDTAETNLKPLSP